MIVSKFWPMGILTLLLNIVFTLSILLFYYHFFWVFFFFFLVFKEPTWFFLCAGEAIEGKNLGPVKSHSEALLLWSLEVVVSFSLCWNKQLQILSECFGINIWGTIQVLFICFTRVSLLLKICVGGKDWTRVWQQVIETWV